MTSTHNSQKRLTGQTAGAALAISYTAYDANGNLQSRNIDGAAQNYQYDPLNRLDTATGSFGSRDYRYDKNGNRLTLNDGAATTAYTYIPNSNRLSASGADPVSTDLNGNTWIKGNGSYGYTTTNRLKQIIAANQLIAGYDHNGLGQRVTKTLHNQTITGHPDQSDINATVQAILGTGAPNSYSDCNTDSQINVQDLACLNNAITANTQGTTATTHYTYGLNGQLLAESGATTKEYITLNGTPLAVIDNATIYYVHTDHLATPYKLTNSTGTVVWSASYDPFGSATTNEDPDNDGTHITFNLRFPGQYADGESGLHYNWHRYYDPRLGRYITSDPVGLVGGTNSYTYVENDPLNYFDPNGLAKNGATQRLKDRHGLANNIGDILSPPNLYWETPVTKGGCYYGWSFQYKWKCKTVKPEVNPYACQGSDSRPDEVEVTTTKPKKPRGDCRFVGRSTLDYGLICPQQSDNITRPPQRFYEDNN